VSASGHRQAESALIKMYSVPGKVLLGVSVRFGQAGAVGSSKTVLVSNTLAENFAGFGWCVCGHLAALLA